MADGDVERCLKILQLAEPMEKITDAFSMLCDLIPKAADKSFERVIQAITNLIQRSSETRDMFVGSAGMQRIFTRCMQTHDIDRICMIAGMLSRMVDRFEPLKPVANDMLCIVTHFLSIGAVNKDVDVLYELYITAKALSYKFPSLAITCIPLCEHAARTLKHDSKRLVFLSSGFLLNASVAVMSPDDAPVFLRLIQDFNLMDILADLFLNATQTIRLRVCWMVEHLSIIPVLLTAIHESTFFNAFICAFPSFYAKPHMFRVASLSILNITLRSSGVQCRKLIAHGVIPILCTLLRTPCLSIVWASINLFQRFLIEAPHPAFRMYCVEQIVLAGGREGLLFLERCLFQDVQTLANQLLDTYFTNHLAPVCHREMTQLAA